MPIVQQDHDTLIQVPVENLDGMFPDDLVKYAQDALTMAAYATLLGGYAKAKAEAMRHRSAGRIQEALRLEQECDNLYQELPHTARW